MVQEVSRASAPTPAIDPLTKRLPRRKKDKPDAKAPRPVPTAPAGAAPGAPPPLDLLT